MATSKSFRATHNNSEGKNAWLTLTLCFISCLDTILGDSTQLFGLEYWGHFPQMTCERGLKALTKFSKRSLRSKRGSQVLTTRLTPVWAGGWMEPRGEAVISPVNGQL